MKATRPNLMPCLTLTFLSIATLATHFASEQLLGWPYLYTTPVKVVLITLTILGYRRWVSLSGRRRPLSLLPTSLNFPLKGLFLGLTFSVILMISYLTLGSLVDFNLIRSELLLESAINPLNFLMVGLYITVFNSFLEEYFFRGFLVQSFRDLGYNHWGIHFSALSFALYHLGIFLRWFELPLLFLTVTTLYLTGLLLIWANFKTRNVLNGWIAHILANATIMLIGAYAFGWIDILRGF